MYSRLEESMDEDLVKDEGRVMERLRFGIAEEGRPAEQG